MRALKVQRIETEADLAVLEPEWRALEQSSHNDLPFRTFTWVSTWWHHLREARLTVHDSLAMRVFRSIDGRLVGVEPLMITERPRIGPFRVRCLQLIGADPNVTEVRTGVFDPEFAPSCYAALLDDIVRSSGDLDWVHLTGVEDDHGEREALNDVPWGNGVACYLLDLTPTWEEFRSSCPSNTRETLRKCYASLRRDRLEISLDVVKDKADVPTAIDDFLRLHAARAGVSGAVRHPDVFEHPICKGFIHEVCLRFAETGALRVFRLLIAGRVAATRVGFVLGETLYLYYSGFEPALAHLSVGTTLVAEIFKHAIGEKLRTVNLSTGDDQSKRRWRPREHMYHDARIVSPTSASRLKHDAFSAIQRTMRASSVAPYARLLLSRRPRPIGAAPPRA
jgi:CelD/BcsL family acetyltransferase involved in cellulose biosynthesis